MEVSKVFVIIVTYNGKQWYDRCFTSLRTSELPIEVVVIDNASADNTIQYLRTNFPENHLIESATNLGFGQANNKGIRYALNNGADYVFLLNQDAWIEPNTISGLVEIHKKHAEYGILSPMHLNADKSQIEKGLMHYIADYRITSISLINDLYFGITKDVHETQYVNAAAWLLPRNTLQTVGGFDPIFFHYGEDDNYMQRAHFHGFKIGICPRISICHDTERTVERTSQISQSARKILLVSFTNINEKRSIYEFMNYSLRKALLKIIKFKFSLVERYLSDANFIWNMRSRIMESRKMNSQKLNTWL